MGPQRLLFLIELVRHVYNDISINFMAQPNSIENWGYYNGTPITHISVGSHLELLDVISLFKQS